jgi:hypothetical protein
VTKIQVHFLLDGPLNDKQYAQLRDAQAVYGIERISLARTLDRLMVEYDATRLSPLDVESLLRSHNIPVRPIVAAPKTPEPVA